MNNLRGEYKKATIVIAPITIGGGIKIKVIEGLATGRFMIATEKATEAVDQSGL
jgi:hypothetical protein